MTDAEAMLEIYDRDGALVRTIGMTRDVRDAIKWHLAESVSLGGIDAETAVIRFGDGTSEPLPASMFALTTPINTIFS